MRAGRRGPLGTVLGWLIVSTFATSLTRSQYFPSKIIGVSHWNELWLSLVLLMDIHWIPASCITWAMALSSPMLSSLSAIFLIVCTCTSVQHLLLAWQYSSHLWPKDQVRWQSWHSLVRVIDSAKRSTRNTYLPTCAHGLPYYMSPTILTSSWWIDNRLPMWIVVSLPMKRIIRTRTRWSLTRQGRATKTRITQTSDSSLLLRLAHHHLHTWILAISKEFFYRPPYSRVPDSWDSISVRASCWFLDRKYIQDSFIKRLERLKFGFTNTNDFYLDHVSCVIWVQKCQMISPRSIENRLLVGLERFLSQQKRSIFSMDKKEDLTIQLMYQVAKEKFEKWI